MPIAFFVLTQYRRVTDTQTDRQTDRHVAITKIGLATVGNYNGRCNTAQTSADTGNSKELYSVRQLGGNQS